MKEKQQRTVSESDTLNIGYVMMVNGDGGTCYCCW